MIHFYDDMTVSLRLLFSLPSQTRYVLYVLEVHRNKRRLTAGISTNKIVLMTA